MSDPCDPFIQEKSHSEHTVRYLYPRLRKRLANAFFLKNVLYKIVPEFRRNELNTFRLEEVILRKFSSRSSLHLHVGKFLILSSVCSSIK